jgi:hypothetical protein
LIIINALSIVSEENKDVEAAALQYEEEEAVSTPKMDIKYFLLACHMCMI